MRPAAGYFYAGFSAVLLLLVLLGFGPSLYLRPFTDRPSLAPSVLLHGIILTAWYLLAFIQPLLIGRGKPALHRRLGWVLIALGLVVICWSSVVTINFLPSRVAGGLDLNDPARFAVFSAIVWGDVAALAAFIIFLAVGVYFRKQASYHMPLMLFASMSILEPALFRIWGWQMFAWADRNLATLVLLLLMCVVLAARDYHEYKGIRAVITGSSFILLGSRIAALYLINGSELGDGFIRWLL